MFWWDERLVEFFNVRGLAELGRAIVDQALAAAATGAPDGVESLPAGYARMAATLGYAGSQNGPLLVQLSV